MISYDEHFKSKREDGRFYSSFAAHMEMMRNLTPKLAVPENLTKETFFKWQKEVKEKLRELLIMPEFTKQPEPKFLSSVKRDIYTVEKWEFYPDDYTAVPFLILIPDGATKEKPVPAVMCLPGSVHSKEMLAGEPLLDNPMCKCDSWYERNRMAYYMVKNGMVAFAFDNPETCEAGLERDGNFYTVRNSMCYGYIQSGLCYPGVSVFQKLCIMDFIKSREYVDKDRLALSAHSLGTEAALYIALLTDDFKALIFNDGLRDQRYHYMSITEQEAPDNLVQNFGNWHEVPGIMNWFSFPDLCAALAPMPVTFNEGGGECWFEKVKSTYRLFGAEDMVNVVHYPKYQDPKTHIHHGEHAKFGFSPKGYDEFNYIDAPDHSFRSEPSIKLLKECFKL